MNRSRRSAPVQGEAHRNRPDGLVRGARAVESSKALSQREGNAMADEAQILVQSLVERAQSGDGGAFGELYEQFAPEIFRYLLRHLNGRRESAEDLTEEVFLKVLERLGSYQFRGLPFSAWLYRIARNHMIDHLRSRPRQIISSLDAAPEIPEKRAEQVMDRSLDRHELTYALERLTSDQRHVVTLRFLDGFTTAETAQIMGKTEDAVKKLQARGLVQLRRIIEHARRVEEPQVTPAAPTATSGRLVALGAA